MEKSGKKLIYFGDEAAQPAENEGKVKGKLFFSALIAGLFVFMVVCGTGIAFVFRIYQTLPTFSELENIAPPLVSNVYARDGSLIHEFSTERRYWVPLDSINPLLADAVVAIEDRRFYQHWGIDIKRIVGALIVDIIHREFAQGASTLTQQLARNLYLTSRQTLIRKIREVMTAIQLERNYTKTEILELYLNQVYLGAGVYGVQAASQRYFSKPAMDLTLNECAVLAGTIQLPEYYRPDKQKNHKRTIERRNSVLRGMVKLGAVDRQTAAQVKQDTIPSNPQERISKIAPYFIEMVRKRLEAKYGEKILYNGGLNIHTTLDPVAQDTAQEAAKDHLIGMQKRLNRMFIDSAGAYKRAGVERSLFFDHFDSLYAAHKDKWADLPDSAKRRIAQVSVIAVEAKSGAILTLIGGRNFEESKFNRATQSRRQPGSAFKPFVYTAAMDNGLSPSTIVLDQPITLETSEGEWRPENYDREFLGPIPIRKALAKSVNLVAIQVLNKVGAHTVVAYARKFGLHHGLNPVPALAIGACEATPMEMASAYSVFANYGKRAIPYTIQKVYDKTGRLIFEHEIQEEDVIAPSTAFIMADLMCDVVRRGTGAGVVREGFTRPCAGKTGTTNDYSDAWFVGYTPQIACAAWVGVDERRSLGRGVTGARGTLPIWIPTMKALHRDLPVESFAKTEGVITTRVCNVSNKLAGPYCSDVRVDYFKKESLADSCDIHVLKRSRRQGDFNMFGSQQKRTIQRDGQPEKKKKRLMF
ncbi:MAG: PBP1A family penicillin-binding protein [Chitinivibrionales bacterium]|nr:PBP1A family penicillin-binding protein [Chitinivibrionales bacterium]